ncbi:MAG TPA: TolC family protein [Candidatus Brocadiia bacterium]|nr:TolC family protein [Candidatus Brocadiia bacterium]
MSEKLKRRTPSGSVRILRPGAAAAIALILIAAAGLQAQDAAKPPDAPVPADKLGMIEPGEETMQVSLKDCIVEALENNYDIRIARLGPGVEDTNIDAAKAVFDPVAKASASRDYKKRPTVSVLDVGINLLFDPQLTAVTEEDRNYTGSIEKKFSTGTTVTASQTLGWVSRPDNSWSAFDPYYNSEATLEVVQPLLKGAGFEYNLADIRIARNTKTISEYDFEIKVIETVKNIELAYWNLVRARGFVEASLKSLERAKKLYETVDVRVRAGNIYPHALDEARAQVAIQEDALNTARLQSRNAEDAIKQLMGMSGGDSVLARSRLVPTDDPKFIQVSMDWKEAELAALERRPEVGSAAVGIKNANLGVKKAENENQVQADLTARGSLIGLGVKPNDTWNAQQSTDYYLQAVSGTVIYPIRMRAAKAGLQQARLKVKSASYASEQQRQAVIVEVRSALRGALQKAKSVESARVILESRERSRDDEMKRFEVGRSTLLQVVEAQERLAEAERDLVGALADYRIAISALFQSMGTLLDRNGVYLERQTQEYTLSAAAPAR